MEEEANICDINHLDGDVLLPPRKRLLAGLKKQNADSNSHLSLLPTNPSTESDMPINKLLGSHVDNLDLSPEDLVEASKAAAVAAIKVAEAARAAAEEKAAVAVKAIAAAKSALELVASVSKEAASKERDLKKSKLKKHVPVQLLYKKHQPVENYKNDADLARKLHRDMNSSPRISKNCVGSNSKTHNKHKKPKVLHIVEKTRTPSTGVLLGKSPHSTCNGHAIAGKLGSPEGSIPEVYTAVADRKTSESKDMGQLELEGGHGEAGNSEETISEALDDACTSGRKRGRIKLKKLPLSNCAFRDQANPKEEMKSRIATLVEEKRGKHAVDDNMPLFSMESSSDGVISAEAAQVWKCQAFKTTECVKQNKIMQS